MHDAPVIIGGGVAGGAVAVLLARAGRRPLLLEREQGAHDKVCGEFVSGEAARLLAHLGLDVAVLGAAPVGRVRLVHGTRIADAALPFAAWGLSRRRLDAALLDAAERDGAEVRRGVAVRGIGPDGAVVLPGEELRTDTVLLATGKHELRGAGREARSEALVGLKLHLRLAPRQASRLAGYVELYLLEGGYAGLQPVEDGVVNLCLIAPAARFGAAGRSAAALIEALGAEAPQLGVRLGGAEALWPRPLAVARVPYGHLHRPTPRDLPGVFRLGDQAAVIPKSHGRRHGHRAAQRGPRRRGPRRLRLSRKARPRPRAVHARRGRPARGDQGLPRHGGGYCRGLPWAARRRSPAHPRAGASTARPRRPQRRCQFREPWRTLPIEEGGAMRR